VCSLCGCAGGGGGKNVNHLALGTWQQQWGWKGDCHKGYSVAAKEGSPVGALGVRGSQLTRPQLTRAEGSTVMCVSCKHWPVEV
jgi:hypothetical protein